MTDINITLTLTNLPPATAAAVLALLGGGTPINLLTAGAEAPAEGKPAKPARTAAKAATPETSPETTPQTAPEPSSSEAASSTDQADAGTASTGVTYDQVRAAVLSLTAKKGRDEAVKVIGSFQSADGKPAANGKELQESDWQAFIDAAKEAEEGLA